MKEKGSIGAEYAQRTIYTCVKIRASCTINIYNVFYKGQGELLQGSDSLSCHCFKFYLVFVFVWRMKWGDQLIFVGSDVPSTQWCSYTQLLGILSTRESQRSFLIGCKTPSPTPLLPHNFWSTEETLPAPPSLPSCFLSQGQTRQRSEGPPATLLFLLSLADMSPS